MTVADGCFGLPPRARYTPVERWPLCLADVSMYKLVRLFCSRDDVMALEAAQPFPTPAAFDAWWTTTALPQLQVAWLAEVDQWVLAGNDLEPCAYADAAQIQEFESLCNKIPGVTYCSTKMNLRFMGSNGAGGKANPTFGGFVGMYGTIIEAAVAAASTSNDKHRAKAIGAFSYSLPLLRIKNPELGRPEGVQFKPHHHQGNRTAYDQGLVDLGIISYPQFVGYATNGGQVPDAVVHPASTNAALQGLVRRLCEVTGAVATFEEAAQQAFLANGPNPVRARAMLHAPAAAAAAAAAAPAAAAGSDDEDDEEEGSDDAGNVAESESEEEGSEGGGSGGGSSSEDEEDEEEFMSESSGSSSSSSDEADDSDSDYDPLDDVM